jgi:CheY-like chemotaxis protein
VADTLAYGLGREILSFVSDQDAREYIAQDEIAQVLLVGLDGSDLNGIELINAIRQSFPGKTCIAMSAMAEHEKQAAQMGVDGFLAKPFGIADLFELADHFIVEADTRAAREPDD